jgi:hypothetical protein
VGVQMEGVGEAMKAELEVIRGAVHDEVVGRLEFMGKTYESKCSPEMGHISRRDLDELMEIFREKLEKNLKQMVEDTVDEAYQ